MLSEQYLNRRYRADSFEHYQTPVYYLGKRGWHVVGKPMQEYGGYRRQIEQRSERTFSHTLALYDVILKFLLESEVKRIIFSEDRLWQETIDFGNIPDAWIQFSGGEAFIELDLNTEHVPVLKKKFGNYIAFRESGRYERVFPGCRFKVLVFTTSEQRIGALEQVIATDDVWFCTLEDFLKNKLNDAHWFALRGFYALSDLGKKEM